MQGRVHGIYADDRAKLIVIVAILSDNMAGDSLRGNSNVV
jgi:hypothetical protein